MVSSQTKGHPSAISPDGLREHWQGHRCLTRRAIELFPDDELFTFSLGGMRTFGELAMEMITVGVPLLRGIVTGTWGEPDNDRSARPKDEVLRLWDEGTAEIEELWPLLAPERFHETVTAFGQWPGKVHELILYGIDNEIHHRGQGYVYLRALGVEPPPFYDRS